MRNIAWTLSSSSWVVIMFVSLVLSTSPPHLVQCVRAGDSLRMLNAVLESSTSAKELYAVAQPAVAGMKAGAAPAPAVILVDQGGLGDYKTVGEAIAAIPIHNKDPVIIYIHAGVYEEQIVVLKSQWHITLVGAGREVTKITSRQSAGATGTTYTTSTVGISASYFTAKNITFENTSPVPLDGAVQQQAVALRTTGDFNAFYGCGFLGGQDTLYDDRGRHYFKECFIQGSVDFIFGDGTSLYENCELNVIPTDGGSLTAQKRQFAYEGSGYSFVNCAVTGSGPPTVLLGRAWGAYSRVVFAYTYFADIIAPQGWFDWDVTARDSTAFYGEYKCFGPGANANGRVSWSHQLSDAEAAPFLSTSFVDGQLWV
ncbi:hypothetical protein BDL97_12G056900 [Sphagnum fallax]|nr:hypothetical protein BDL97_12G056900 [Sphagnum fallax]